MYISSLFSNKKKMDLLEQAIENKHVKMITFLLREDPTLIHHILSNGTSVLEALIQVQF